MNAEQIAMWFFSLTAAHIYQFIKSKLGIAEKVALWGLLVYAFVVSIIATLIGGGWPPFTDPSLLLEWLGTHVAPIMTLATLLYKGFGKTDAVTKAYTPGLGISKFG